MTDLRALDSALAGAIVGLIEPPVTLLCDHSGSTGFRHRSLYGIRGRDLS